MNNATVSLPPTTTSSSQSTDSVHQACDSDVVPSSPVMAVPVVSSSSDYNSLTETAHTHTAETANGVVGADGILPTTSSMTAPSEEDKSVPGAYACRTASIVWPGIL